jgi:glycosyltransferase involved in cell wall biosynthesis
MQNSKVSICLPVYNGSRFLAQAIETVLNQTHQNWELLIADDCSHDDSVKIAALFAEREPRIKHWVNSRNLSIFANYNECINRATGEFIKPFAQDDLFEPTCLERLSQSLLDNPDVSLVTAARAIIDGEGNRTGIERFFDKTLKIHGEDVIREYTKTFVYRTGTPSQVMFRRANKGSGFDTNYFLSGDIEYFFRILESGEYLYLDEVLVSFRRHGESATVTMLKDMSFVSDSFNLMNKYRHFIKDPDGKVPLVHKPLMEGLIRKVNNAVHDRNISFEDAITGNAEGRSDARSNSAPLNFELPAYQLLLYAADLSYELDTFKREHTEKMNESVRRSDQLERRIAAMEKEREALESRLTSVNDVLKELYSSKSWRLTEALRRLKNTFRPS